MGSSAPPAKEYWAARWPQSSGHAEGPMHIHIVRSCRGGALSVGLFLAVFAATPAQAQSPIQHVVVIFQENVSFDHYFGTYPTALNPAGEPAFHARRGTPTVNGLTGALLTRNPNAVNPFRFSRAQAATCDQDHDYGDEQKAYHGGLVDLFVQTVGNG